MGKKHKRRNLSLRNHFIANFLLIMFYSMLTTAIIWLISFIYIGGGFNKLSPTVFIIGSIGLLVPFGSVLIFSIIFGKRLGRKFNRSRKDFLDGAKRIQQQDLEFSFNKSHGAKELNLLAAAFENIRYSLQSSLFREKILKKEQHAVAAIVHDLHNPLTDIEGYVEGVVSGGVQNKDHFQQIFYSIDQDVKILDKLVKDIDYILEIDEACFQLAPSAVDIDFFIREKAKEYEFWAQQKKIQVAVRKNDLRVNNAPVYIDADRLAQIIDNIIANSIRFSPVQGHIGWDIKIENNLLSFEICDTGPGFAEKDLPYVFEKYYQGESQRSMDKVSAGLGLYITKKLVEKHGGEINVKNNPTGGACVMFTIPFLTSEK